MRDGKERNHRGVIAISLLNDYFSLTVVLGRRRIDIFWRRVQFEGWICVI